MIAQLGLQTDKPIIFFDLETTGVNVCKDRIVELAAIKFHLDGTLERLHHLINPGFSIPAEAVAIHGITDEVVSSKPLFVDLSEEIQGFFSGSDIGGFNVMRFDIPLLHEELLRSKKQGFQLRSTRVIDACNLYHIREPRNLEAAVKFYTGSSHENAHSAMADVEATINVISGQLRAYPDIPANVESIHNMLWGDKELLDLTGWFVRGNDRKVYFLKGAHKGDCVEQHRDYLDWMKFKAQDMAASTKDCIDRILREVNWRDGFRGWLKGSKADVSIPHLDCVLDCLENLQSSGVVEVLTGEGEVHLTLRCGKAEPVEMLIDCLEQKRYLVDYLHYAIKAMEKRDVDTQKYGALLYDLKQCVDTDDHEEGLVNIHAFINKGLEFSSQDFTLQRRFKKLINGFTSSRQYVSSMVEADNYQASRESLKSIYDEGVANLCLELELFFDQEEKSNWIGGFSVN